jgi:hypothetical protein
MTDATYFILGLIVGIGSMVLIILGWSLMNISSQISREEEMLYRPGGDAWDNTRYQEVDTQPLPLPPDDDVKSS